MYRKKLIHKIAFVAAIIFVISIVILILQIPYRTARLAGHNARLKAHLAQLTQQSQSYLKEVAKQITSVPVDERIIHEFQSRYFEEHQQIDQAKKYLWLSDTSGAFIFGAPNIPFIRMNQFFDKFQEEIVTSGRFIDRNDFLVKWVHKYDQDFLSSLEMHLPSNQEDINWDYFNDQDNNNYYWQQPRSTNFSTTVLDLRGNLVGTLYLKVDDVPNEYLYFSGNRIARRDLFSVLIPIFGGLAFFSGVLLWFLLPTWVYIDSQLREMPNHWLWPGLALLSGPFGLLIYLITRPSATKLLLCPQCEKELNGAKAFCPYCGFDVSKTLCPQCQYPIQSDWNFCPSCRADLTANRTDFTLLADIDPVKKIE